MEEVSGSMFRVRPIVSRSLPASRFRPTVWRSQCGVSEIVMEFSRVWRCTTCLCQQEILVRLLLSEATCQEDISTYGQRPSDSCFSWSLNLQKFMPRSDAGAPRVIACACFGTLWYCVVCAGVGGDQIVVGFRVINCWRWTCSVCGP